MIFGACELKVGSVIIFEIKLPPKFSHHSREGPIIPETFLFEGTVLRIRPTKRCSGTRLYPNSVLYPMTTMLANPPPSRFVRSQRPSPSSDQSNNPARKEQVYSRSNPSHPRNHRSQYNREVGKLLHEEHALHCDNISSTRLEELGYTPTIISNILEKKK